MQTMSTTATSARFAMRADHPAKRAALNSHGRSDGPALGTDPTPLLPAPKTKNREERLPEPSPHTTSDYVLGFCDGTHTAESMSQPEASLMSDSRRLAFVTPGG